jgi:Carboxypeptidase regulatory-like domain/Putative zinc-finger
MHPDADQLTIFVEGAATAREHERMLAHLADCAECRKAVFLMQPREEAQPATPTLVNGWVWRRLLPAGFPAAALACALIAVLIHMRPRGGAPEMPQQDARLRRPQIQPLEVPAAPTVSADSVARSAKSTNGAPGNPTTPNLSGQKDHPVGGLISPEAKSPQKAANLASPQTTAAVPAVSVPVVNGAIVPGSIRPRIESEVPLNGRNVTNLQQLSTAPPTQAATSQNALAAKKNLPALERERASGQSATLAGISGHISDRTGAMVAGATITLRDASGKTRQTTTGTDGSFHLTEVPAGQYEFAATANGFATSKQSIDLKPSELALLRPVLDPGTVSETVEVQAASAARQIQTESANVGGQVVAGLPSVGGVLAVPSGLPVAETVSQGKRFLSLDSAGNLFLSRNRGKKWMKINPQWAGKAVRIELTPPASGAAFQMTTDAGAVWTSKDGTHWRQQSL